MKKHIITIGLITLSCVAHASEIIPVGHDNNSMYYKIGGGSDFSLPPVSDTNTISLDTNSNLGMGNSCGAFNPALSIVNSINDLKDSADNIEKSVLVNATGSIIQIPMYAFAQANPTAYNILNNKILSSHNELDVSTKSCQVVKDQIAQGQNPYQDWGTLAVGDQWKKHLSLVSAGTEDINHTKKEIDAHSGDDGVTWVTGNKDSSDGSLHAGGVNQQPIHVISDTVKAGYNAMLNRSLDDNSDASSTGSSAELSRYFRNPQTAVSWITNVIGDQTITTCNDTSCKKAQGSVVGHGLLPWITTCADKDNCVATIRTNLGNLVTGNTSVTKDNLTAVSADGIVISPEVISSIHNMDATQQSIIVNKLAQEVAMQRLIDKALIARNILSTGAQVPVISANHPAQVAIATAITNLDNDIRSITFENQIRKQTMSDTVTQVLDYADKQKQSVMSISPVSASPSMMSNGALPNKKDQ